MKSAENQKTILLVDDAGVNRTLLKKILGSLYQIAEARDGAEAMELLHTLAKVDIVLLDIVMPRMDGYHVLQAMMADSNLCRIPVIVATASGDAETQIRALDYGAADVITKPYQARIIQHRVNNILRRMDSEHLAERSRMFEQQIRRMETDEKTGLYNKLAFCRHVAQLLEKDPAGRYAILRWDIDHFRAFNEIYGMAAGDALLAEIGRVYRTEALPAQGVMIAGHWHADCFVTLRRMDTFEPNRLLEQLDAHMAKLYPDFEFVTRAGVYEITDRTLDAALMCDRAMLALRSVKNSAQARCGWYDEAMRQNLLEEQEISNEARTALTAGQFVVYFQPQYNYAEHALSGAEALVRWNHPRKGLIPPGRFIPLFEENGFISALDQYVWRQACICLRAWLDAGIRPVPVSVNISRQDIYHASLCGNLQKLLEEYHLPPELLHLEITESAYMENPEQLVRVVHQLQGYGFHVEMDDFGSGYSSLNMLKDVAVDTLKLDMRFLSSSNEQARGGSILSAVVHMAHGIGLPVIAEGVETLQQANYLKSIGCLYMQGYLFAKPMDEESYRTLLQRAALAGPDLRFSTGIGGSTDFLSATTQSTLLFNSFVGGAAIAEYENGEVHTLRVNDKFLEILHLSYEDYEKGRDSLLDMLPWECHAPFLDMVKKAIRSGQEAACEVSTRPRHEGEGERWLRVRARFLAKQATGELLYMAIDDISMRMNLLRHNEQLSHRLSDVMRNLPGAVYSFEIHGEAISTVYFNDIAAKMFGYTREEYARLFAADALQAICPEDRERMRCEIEQVVSGKLALLTARYRHPCKDGSQRWVSITGSISRHDAGDTVYASAILMDIQAKVESEKLTARQAAELERQRTFLQQLYSTIPCGIVQLYREKGRMHLASLNDAAWRLFGFSGQAEYLAAVQKHGQLFGVHPDDRALMEENLHNIFAGGKRTGCDHRILRADGSVRWVHTLMQKVPGPDGRVVVQIVFTDVTDQIRADRGRFSRALLGAYDATYELDAEQGSCIVRTERGAESDGRTLTIARYLEETAAGLAAEKDRAALVSFLDFTKAGEKPGTLEYRCRTAQGEERWVSSTLLHVGGSCYLLCNRDITDEKHAAQLVRQNGLPRQAAAQAGHKVYRLAGSLCALRQKMQQGALALPHADAGPEKELERLQADNTILREETEEKERYRIIVEHTDCAVLEWNFQTGRFYASESFSRYALAMESPQKLCKNEGDPENVYAEDRPQLAAFFQMAGAGAPHTECELRLKVQGGGYRWTRMAGEFVRDKAGKILRAIGTLVDVDDAVRARHTAEKSAAGLRETLLSLPGGILVYHSSSPQQPQFANDHACEMFGFTHKEYALAAANGDGCGFPPELAAIAAENTPQTSSAPCVQVTRKDGSRFWLRVACHYEKKPDGLVCCMALMDVSEQVRIRQAADTRRQEASAMIHLIPGGIFKYSAEDDQQFSYVSDNMLEMLGYTREEFLQRFHNRFPDMIYQADRDRVCREIREQICKDDFDTCEYRIETRSGELKWVYDAGHRVTDENGRSWFVVVIVDIDRRKALEQELQTERRRTEALSDQHGKVEGLLRALPTGIATLSYRAGKWAMAAANETLCHSIGCLCDAVPGASPAEVHGLLHPDDGSLVDTALEKLFSENHSTKFECRILNCNTRRYVWLLCEGISLVQPDGSQMAYLICSNIKDWAGALAASRRQTAYLETLYDLLPCGVSELDANWNFTFMNRAGRLMLGESALAQSVELYTKVLPEDRARLAKTWKNARTLDKPQAFEVRILSNDKIRWLNGVVRRTVDPGNQEIYLTIYNDVTEIKAAQMQMETLIQHLPGGVALYGVEGGRLLRKFHSEGMGSLLEYLRDENVSDDVLACIERYACTEDRPRISAALQQGIGHRQPLHCIFRTLPQEGGCRWIEFLAAPMETPDGNLQFCGICNDITEKKAAEEEEQRRRSAELHRFREEMHYLEAAQDENMIAKARYNLTRKKVESCDVLGYRYAKHSEESGEQVLQNIAAHGDSPKERAALHKLLDRENILNDFAEGKNYKELEYRRKDSTGRAFWARTILKTFKDPESGDIKAFIYSYDVNEKKTMQATIDRIAELHFELLGVVDVQTGFLHCYRHTDFEEQMHCGMEMLYQAASESFVRTFIPAEERTAAQQAFSMETICACLKSENAYSVSFTVEKDKKHFRKQWSFLYLDASHTAIILARTDVTTLLEQQDRQQKQLRWALQQAQEASRAKTEFLASISHEMRTPMNAIIGLTELTADRAQDEEFVRKAMRQVAASSGLLLRQINDLLDMSGLQSESIRLKKTPCRLPMLLAQLELLIRPQCEQKHISLEWAHLEGKSTQAEVMVDLVRFQQVFFNLLSNAVKFTPEGGCVRFSIREIEYTPEQVRICAVVADNGIGMAEDFQQHLFEPFTREHMQEDGETAGAGIGLAIAKRIIDRMEGTIRVESVLGKGTTFTVELTLALCHTPHSSAENSFALPQEDMALLAGKHVLLVDDNRINLDIGKALLQKQKMLVDCAENGKTALEAYAASPEGYYAVVLMDIRMPVMDGLAATRAIRALPRRDAALTPVLSISANAFPEDQENTYAAGIDELIPKPIQPAVLYEKIIRFLKNGRSGR
ncbi:MAG: PAS domain-containing protein [Faecalibacterium sp.]|jgi:PAS domain S-box-containing protein|nr:PAS domain-containing protein [Faecalibacterium sp.]